MSEELNTRAREALRLYDEESRAFLQKHLPVAVEGLDRRASLLRDALAVKAVLDVGFVGESQVGKSTLLNALIGEYALPSGGIGPLTAQAIHVRYAAEPFFIARYHGKKRLNEARFAIERLVGYESSTGVDIDGESTGELSVALEGEDLNESRVGDDLIRSVERLFGVAHDSGDRGRVAAHCLRLALGQKPREERELSDAVHERVAEVAALLGTETRIDSSEGQAAFLRALKLRAANWHSALVAELEVFLHAPLLEALHLVDLPGVGTINDPSQEETRRFVRQGDALAVIVRNNGVTEAVVHLLEKAEFITRWMWSADTSYDGGGPIHAMIIVTHLDDVARSRFREAKQRARESGDPIPSRDAIFSGIAAEMTEKVREDLRAEFLRSPSFESLETGDSAVRKKIVEKMCNELRVHCVAAPDALEIQHGDPDDAFLKDMQATGIPALRTSLTDLASRHKEERIADIHERLSSFAKLLKTSIERARLAYTESAEVGLVRRFREEAGPFLAKLESEMTGLHGRCMTRLSEGIPERLAELCQAAERAGLQKLKVMRRHADDLHYQSLNAALRRSGTWDNFNIDFPGGITRTFVEKIAAQWTETVVEPVRSTLRETADHDAELVQQLVRSAASVDPELVERGMVEAHITSMREAADSCVPWSNQHLDDLRRRVEDRLSDAVMEPIAAACEEALQAGRNRGTGAKKRIIQVFEDGGERALEEATGVALALLHGLYDDLFTQLKRDYLDMFDNPVAKVFEAITAEADSREEVERQALQAEVEAFADAFLPHLESTAA